MDPITAAMSASVDGGGLWKKFGCAIPPVAFRPAIAKPRFRCLRAGARCLSVKTSFLEAFSSGEPVPRLAQNTLERCSAAELELLHAVKLALGQRHGVIEAQRSER